jgi:glutamate/aspartate transport system permease protein
MNELAADVNAMLLALVKYNLGLALGAILIALPIACLVAMGRLSPVRIVHAVTTVYVNVLRSIPLLMVMFWFYAVGPMISGRPVSPYFAALTSIAAFEVAYFAEIIRSGLQSVSVGQRNAGLASALSKRQVLWLIILPQALRRMMPALLSQALITFQESTVASVISVPEILDTTTVINSRGANTIFLYSALAATFLVLCYSLSVTIRYVDGRSRRRIIGWAPVS